MVRSTRQTRQNSVQKRLDAARVGAGLATALLGLALVFGSLHAQTQTPERDAQLNELIAAGAGGELGRVRQLLSSGPAGPKSAAAVRVLVGAIERDQAVLAGTLIEAGVDVNAMDESGQSAFLAIAASGNADLVRLALGNGAQVDSRDSAGSTALIRAARTAHNNLVLELLRSGADLNQKNRIGRTALAEAIAAGDGGPRHTDTVRILIRAGADQTIRDSSGMTAIQYARQREYREMAAVLTSVGGR
jgi:ankyrin repeat protein